MFALSLVFWQLGIVTFAPQISTFANPVPNSRSDGLNLAGDARNTDLNSKSALLALEANVNARRLAQVDLSQTIWSLAFLVFALAWIAVHPNYPSPYDSPWMKLRRKLMLVLWALLFPELILYWSVRQWIGARKIREKFKDKGWTLIDAHFLQMGGLVLAPLHGKGPEGKTRFFTLTSAVMELLYNQYAKYRRRAETNDLMNRPVSESTSSGCPFPTPSGSSQEASQPSEFKHASTSAELLPPRSTSAPLPDLDIFLPPPESVYSERKSRPSSSTSKGTTFIEEVPIDTSRHASTSAEQLPPRRIPVSFSDIDKFLPPPDSIDEIDTPLPSRLASPLPHSPQSHSHSHSHSHSSGENPAELSPREREIVNLVMLSAIHIQLPSSLPPLQCYQPHQPTAETQAVTSNNIASTFPADPLLAGIVILQLIWFLSGCIARIAVGGWRELLLVEVVALAYVSIYLVIIVVWWDKPTIGLSGSPAKVAITGGKDMKKGKKSKKEKSFGGGQLEKEFKVMEFQGVPQVQDKGKKVDRLGGQQTQTEFPGYAGMEAYSGSTRNPRGLKRYPEPPPPTQNERNESKQPRPQAAGSPATEPEKFNDASSIRSEASNFDAMSTEEPVYSTIWKVFFVQRPFSRFFRLDRVYEFFLKITGDDLYSHEYELSTDPRYSNVIRKSHVRVRREGKRHWRRNESNASRLPGLTQSENDKAIANLVFGDGYQHQLYNGQKGHFGNENENGVSDSVRRRREAGSGGQSRLPTFYAYVSDQWYYNTRKMHGELVAGFLCMFLFGGIHLLGIAYRELPSEEGGAFASMSPAQIVYFTCSLLLTVAPLFITFSSLHMFDRTFEQQSEELAIAYAFIELLGVPMTMLYFLARVGVIVVALLQLVRRFRLGVGLDTIPAEMDGGRLGLVFDGVNPIGAWWTRFLPHFA